MLAPFGQILWYHVLSTFHSKIWFQTSFQMSCNHSNIQFLVIKPLIQVEIFNLEQAETCLMQTFLKSISKNFAIKFEQNCLPSIYVYKVCKTSVAYDLSGSVSGKIQYHKAKMNRSIFIIVSRMNNESITFSREI